MRPSAQHIAALGALSPEDLVRKVAQDRAKVAALQIIQQALVSGGAPAAKTAAAVPVHPALRALLGAAAGGLGGGLLGGGISAWRGEDPAAGARRGALGGMVVGGGLGAASGLSGGGLPEGFGKALGRGAEAVAIGAGTVGGSALLRSMAIDPEAEEQKARELGRFQAQREIKTLQRQELAPLHAKAFQTALQDEHVQAAPMELMQSTYDTMRNFAPNLSADPHATTSFLREAARFGSGPSYAMLKNLADAESSVAKGGGIG